MSEISREIAERVVKAKHWRWMEGMSLCYGGFRVLSSVSNREHAIYGPDGEGDYEVIAADIYRMLPDLNDPATLGCVMALVREAYANAVVIRQGNGWWSVETDYYDWDQDNTASFREALVKALEAAP